MPGVFSKVFSPVNEIPLAPEIVNSVRNAFRVDVFLGTSAEVFARLVAVRVLNTGFEHCARLHAQNRVLVVVWLKIFLPNVLQCAHCLIYSNKSLIC